MTDRLPSDRFAVRLGMGEGVLASLSAHLHRDAHGIGVGERVIIAVDPGRPVPGTIVARDRAAARDRAT